MVVRVNTISMAGLEKSMKQTRLS